MNAVVEQGNALLSRRQTAAQLGISVATLDRWRVSKAGPKFVRLSNTQRAVHTKKGPRISNCGVVRYRQSAVDEWLEARTDSE
jgi:predicted DNA-binding transcriptional regulator AlpA